MIRSFVLAAALLALAGCLGAGVHDVSRPYVAPITPLDWTRLTPDLPGIASQSGFLKADELVVSDSQTFLAVWKQAFGDVPAPDVDFHREIVLVAAMGARSTGGYQIEVTSVGIQAGDIVADVESVSPGKDCVVTMAPTSPVDVVKIPWRLAPIRFVDQAVIRNCGQVGAPIYPWRAAARR
jgi:protease stability complex PrcB-like protein